MLGWTIQVTAISLCFIAVVHYLYIFFKTTLTVPKVKDLVNRPQQQYDELFKGIGSTESIRNSGNNHASTTTTTTTSISSLPPILYNENNNNDNYRGPMHSTSTSSSAASAAAMKDELKQFVKKLNGGDRGINMAR